ncbi:MAG: hypothetical protein QW220_01225 [Candidatus Bathyarchaeia archaeon]
MVGKEGRGEDLSVGPGLASATRSASLPESASGQGSEKVAKGGGRTPKMALKYFSLLLSRNFSDADEILRRIKEKTTSDWEKGYVNAMEGLMVSFKSEVDELLYLNRIMGNTFSIKKARVRFLKMGKGPTIITTSFEEGFAKCWLDFLKVLGNHSKEK